MHCTMLYIGEDKTVYITIFLRRQGVYKQSMKPKGLC